MINDIVLIALTVLSALCLWKIYILQSELKLHRTELIRLTQWSQQASSTIHEITQHLRYIVEMDKTKKQFPFWGVKGEA